jgi:hypothetical protein
MGTRGSWRHRSRLPCGLLVCIHMLLCVSSVSAQACEGNPPAVDNNAWDCKGTGSGAMCQGKCHAGALQPTHVRCSVVWTATGHCMHASDCLHCAAARRSGTIASWRSVRGVVCGAPGSTHNSNPLLTLHSVYQHAPRATPAAAAPQSRAGRRWPASDRQARHPDALRLKGCQHCRHCKNSLSHLQWSPF